MLEQKNCCLSYVDTVVTVKLTKPWKPEVIIIVWNVIGVQGKTIRYVNTKLISPMITSFG